MVSIALIVINSLTH